MKRILKRKKLIIVLEKSISNSEALTANQNKLNQHALEQAKSDQATQLAAANQTIAEAQNELNSATVAYNNLNAQITSLADQLNATADEPTGALDSQTGHMIMDIFHRLHENQGKTIVLITHSKDLAAETQRIIILNDGMITSSGAGGGKIPNEMEDRGGDGIAD